MDGQEVSSVFYVSVCRDWYELFDAGMDLNKIKMFNTKFQCQGRVWKLIQMIHGHGSVRLTLTFNI
ncbi:hypothetical protein BLOT_007895 [Blomia tropicalis]|nr:hypothetical protein BLOT_007895 [Blomia tropicalis]